MLRKDQLKYCTTCLNKKFNPQKGVICKLTDDIANFDPSCQNYQPDGTPSSKIVSQITQPLLKVEEVPTIPIKKTEVKEKFSLKDLQLILAVAFPTVFFIRLSTYANFYSNDVYSGLMVILILTAGALVSNLLRKNYILKYSINHNTIYIVVFSLSVALINLIYIILGIENSSYMVSDYISIAFMLWILSLVFGFFSTVIVMLMDLIFKRI
ncbi:MAG: hypothetical protein CVU05_06100 [Bacteroidetes bacterium HGW-Bacteroidetes-21]|jgi:hypothetical protein|nr:MAG: hypothetical protein CVU05_06100 [Bacteroidetes bacterium HGW-Bacteroidetes-21]